MAAGAGGEQTCGHIGRRALSSYAEQGEKAAASCVRLQWRIVHRDRTESENQITLGCDGARGEESNAVYSGWQVHRGGGGWKSDAVRQAQSMSRLSVIRDFFSILSGTARDEVFFGACFDFGLFFAPAINFELRLTALLRRAGPPTAGRPSCGGQALVRRARHAVPQRVRGQPRIQGRPPERQKQAAATTSPAVHGNVDARASRGAACLRQAGPAAAGTACRAPTGAR